MHADYLRLLGAHFVAQAVGEAPGGRLAGAVSAQCRAVDPARDREHVQDRATAIRRQYRRERLAQAQGTEEIGFKLGTRRFFTAVCEKATEVRDARIVDQQRDVVATRRGSLNLGRVGHIELDGLNAGQFDARRVSGAGVDLARAAGQRLACEGQPDATVGASDEDDGVVEFHGEVFW